MWKVVSIYSSILVIGTADIVQMDIIRLYGNVFLVTLLCCGIVENVCTLVRGEDVGKMLLFDY